MSEPILRLGVASLAILALTSAVHAQDAVAQTAALEKAILPVITEQMQEMGIPGLVAIVQSPSLGYYAVAAGVADREVGTAMTLDHHFRVGSITKTMTATLVLQLAQEGKFDLDDKLSQFFPDMETNDATVRQALNMTAGIANYSTVAFLDALADSPDRVWTPNDLVDVVKGVPADFPAGEGWHYSNTNYVLLGLLAEKFGGASLATLTQERLFDPLKMDGCSFAAADDATIPAPFSHGYQYGTKWEDPTPPAPLPELVDVTHFNPSWGYAAGDAICTAADMVIWADALVDGTLLSAEMQAERMEFVTLGAMPYGLGIARLNSLVGHHAHMSGFQSQATRRTADDTVIVVVTNITQAPDMELPATKIAELIQRAIPAQ
ncbi:beta-lactamase family protein [Devosia sp. WQ 349]|uniref:serine hydrolase domain-containing protein n=1 Tax=Devosia sp. WQ 349K1 TaxID=2800329 RepID=UPI00190606DD|nr:serine hydrolase domain-containing protein [Devosia sp. WQ 349K1]MBK1793255.1 beta-lactamase family protein [Devosia sp. WQ 349K1]